MSKGKNVGEKSLNSQNDVDSKASDMPCAESVFLHEYSNLFAFLGKHDYLRNKKGGQRAANAEEVRAHNLLFVYGDVCTETNDFLKWAANELKSSKDYIYARFDVKSLKKATQSAKELNAWFVNAFGEEDMRISKMIDDFVSREGDADEGDIEAAFNGIANVVDIVFGAGGFGAVANAMAVFKLVPMAIDYARTNKAVKSVDTSNLKQRMKNLRNGDRNKILNPECRLNLLFMILSEYSVVITKSWLFFLRIMLSFLRRTVIRRILMIQTL